RTPRDDLVANRRPSHRRDHLMNGSEGPLASRSEGPLGPLASRSEGPLGPLAGLRVVELASSRACFAGKLLAIYGAEVIVVEPRGGHETRGWAPFAGDIEDPERSLWWWHYNTNKLGVTLDLDDGSDADALRSLVATADIVLEAETPGVLAAKKLDYPDLRPH